MTPIVVPPVEAAVVHRCRGRLVAGCGGGGGAVVAASVVLFVNLAALLAAMAVFGDLRLLLMMLLSVF